MDGTNGQRHRRRKRIMNFGTLNIQGIRGKLEEVIQEFEKHQFKIITLTETKKKGTGVETIGKYIHFFSGVPKDEHAKRGVSILIRKELKKYVTDWEPIDENLIRVNLKLLQHKLTIFAVYGVSDDANVIEKNEFFETLNSEILKIGNMREIVILGDLNSRTGREKNSNVIGSFGEEITNDNGERLKDICNQHDLKITNGFYKHKNIHKFTWTQPTRGLRSIIDYLIVRQQSLLNVNDVRVLRGLCKVSDHHLLRATFFFPFRRNNKNNHAYENQMIADRQFNIEGFQNESTSFLYKRRLDQYLLELGNQTTQEIYSNLTKSVKQAAEEALGIKSIPKSKKYWWSLEMEELVNQKKQLYTRWLSTKKEEDKKKYNESKRNTRQRIQQQKREIWNRKCQEIETYLGGRQCTESWKFINKVKSTESNGVNLQLIPTDEWETYYKNLLTEHRREYQETPEIPVQIEGEEIMIHSEDVEKVVKQLKNGKSPGPGGIWAELLKYGTTKLYENLACVFTRCVNGEEIPDEWGRAYIISIHKKGNKRQCKNYRGLSVTSTISRVYGRILRDKIEEEYHSYEDEEQSGFRAGRSCTDNVFSLKQIIEKKLARNTATHLLFIDLQKAYDSVPIAKLWEVLQQSTINHTLVKAIQNLYRDMKSAVKIGNTVSGEFKVNKGLRQGCCLSPTLFKIYVAKALDHWKKKCKGMGIQLHDETCVYTLQFADDQVVCADDKDDIEYMTRKLKEEYTKWGLEMNMEKTQYLCIGENQNDIELDNNESINICDKYKYLGVTFTQEGTDDIEIQERNNKARKLIRCLNGIFWSPEINKDLKVRIYNTMVRSTLTYGAETWRLKENLKRKIEATEMDALRRSSRTSRLERVRNDIIKERMQIQETVSEYIERKQLIWFGHVQRMKDERIPKKVMNWTPQGKRRRGRPRKSWIEGIRRSMSERGLENQDCENRREWQLSIGQRRRTL